VSWRHVPRINKNIQTKRYQKSIFYCVMKTIQRPRSFCVLPINMLHTGNILYVLSH